MVIGSARKLNSFEYILKSLLEWNLAVKGTETNDLSILKSLKMLFFVSAAKSSAQTESLLLDDVFNKFVAMPFGHVESDIYNEIKNRNGDLNYFIIDNNSTKRKPDTDIELLVTEIDQHVKAEIDGAVRFLKENYPLLILMPPFDLVNLSHLWFSWKSHYRRANEMGGKSRLIPSEDIKKEDKIFTLQLF